MIEVNTDPRFAPLTDDEIRELFLIERAIVFNAELDALGEEASAIRGAGARLFWVGLDERLHSYDVSSMNRVDYELPLALEVFPGFKAGVDAIVTVTLSADKWQFSAYAVDEPNTLIDTITWPAGGGESDLDDKPVPPIAIDDGDVYLLDPENVLYRWRPGTGAPEPQLSLADGGFALGTIRRFSVHGDDVLVLDNRAVPSIISEGSALWHVAMTTGEVQQAADYTDDACFNAGDALYRVWSPDGFPLLRQYSSSDRRTEDVDALLRQTSVDLGDITLSFADKDMYIFGFQCQPGGLTLDTYRGSFFFDWKKRETQPIFLQNAVNPDGKDGLRQTYIGVALVERVAFLTIERCTDNNAINPCSPPAVYMRDLSAQ